MRGKLSKFDKIEWLLIGLLILTLAVTAGINFHMAHHVLDDDASAELMLAELLHSEKSLYSEDFYYSTEFTLPNQLIFMLLFQFFDGWANVRFIGTCILQLVYLASFLYMMSQSGLGRKAVLTGGILIMLPFTVVYGRTVLYHFYYIFNFIPVYLLTGLLFSLFQHRDASRTSLMVRFVIALLISFLSSLLNIREVFLTSIPMMGCLFFYLLVNSEKEKTPWQKWMLMPAALLIAGLLGMLCNSFFLIPSMNLYQQTEQHLQVLNPALWKPILSALFIQFGFRTEVKLFSTVGVLSLCGLFVAFILFFSSLKSLVNHRNIDFRRYLMRTMLIVNLLVNLAIFTFADIPFHLQADYSRYLVPASVWIVPLLCSHFDMEEKIPHIRKIIFLLCLTIFVLNGVFNGVSFLNSKNFNQPYDGLSYSNPHLADDLQTAIEFIRAHDYPCGYAFAGEANTLVELMNGFPVASLRITPDAAFEYTNWLTRKSHKSIQADKAFFLMNRDEESHYTDALAEVGAERIYFDDEGYVIYDISDLALFREHIREPMPF